VSGDSGACMTPPSPCGQSQSCCASVHASVVFLKYTRCMRVFALAFGLVACVLSSVQHASAQAEHAKRRPIVLVMESSGGVHAASDLRATLNRDVGFRVLSLSEAQHEAVRPAAVLTVALDRSRVVRVVYWDLTGETDSLTAATPARSEDMPAVVLALSSALLDRHRSDLRRELHEGDARAQWLDAANASRAFYAVLGRISRLSPRTNVELRFEDF
jgi:hypothetical protein